jgi:predicted ATPase/DNA-binding CsgD family transcriptional regulator
VPGGAVLIDAAPLTTIDALLAAIATALDVRSVTGQDPNEAIRRALQANPALLILDDADSAATAIGQLIDFLDDCPGINILATAHRPLRLAGEQVIRLGPLEVPPPDTTDPEELLQFAAVALFCDRAQQVRYDFRMTTTDAPAIAELCRRLDGLPLALELVAARSATLSPRSQLELLDRGSGLDLRPARRGGPQPAATADTSPDDLYGSPPRHQDLRAAIAWTEAQASDPARQLLRRLGAFENGAALPEIHAATADPTDTETDTIDALMELVDLNLVEPDPLAEPPRYRLLPTIQAYAREDAAAADTVAKADSRHASTYAALIRDDADLFQEDRIDLLERERDNLNVALDRLIAAGDLERAATTAAAMTALWSRHGLYPADQARLDTLVDHVDDTISPDARSQLLCNWSHLAMDRPSIEAARELIIARLRQGLELARTAAHPGTLLFALAINALAIFVTRDVPGTLRATAEGLQLARDQNDQRWLTRFEYWSGMAAMQAGDLATAAALGTSALERARTLGDDRSLVMTALLLQPIPFGTAGRNADVPGFPEILALARRLGDPRVIGWVLNGQAWSAMAAGNLPEAAGASRDALRLATRTGVWHTGAFGAAVLALIAAARSDAHTVARLQGAITPLLPNMTVALSGQAMTVYRSAVETARTQLGEQAFDAAAAQAAREGFEAAIPFAIAYADSLGAALADTSPPLPDSTATPAKRASGPDALTPRELEVLQLLAAGDSNKEIGQQLDISAKTVMHHSVSIYAKLGVRGRAEATAWAFRNGVVPAA